MTVEEKLSGVKVKIERANKHILELDEAIKGFRNARPYKIALNHDLKTGKPISAKLISIEGVPDPLAAIAGDVIQNLRSALDHLAHQLWLMVPGADPTVEVNFPFWNEPAKFKSALSRKIKRCRQDAIDVLGAVEPCKGLKGHQLWVLNRLNNVDKHRLLITIASSWFHDMSFEDLFSNTGIADFFAGAGIREKIKFPPMVIRAANPSISALKAGDVLPLVVFDRSAESELGKNLYLRFEITLNEPGVIEGKPILETVKQLAGLVNRTVDAFRPCLV
ncbi:MAG: hypothetical protein ACT4P9_04645 [Betaproteobacteria bacterium]